MKQALPGIQFRIIFLSTIKNDRRCVIPSQVDLLVLNYQDCTIPQDLQAQGPGFDPNLVKKVRCSRPHSTSVGQLENEQLGLVPIASPETFRTFAEFVVPIILQECFLVDMVRLPWETTS